MCCHDEMDPFVGREKELAILMEAFENAKNGEGTLVMVEGIAGCGKTKLVERFIHPLRKQEGVLVCRPPMEEEASIEDAYYPFRRLFDEVFIDKRNSLVKKELVLEVMDIGTIFVPLIPFWGGPLKDALQKLRTERQKGIDAAREEIQFPYGHEITNNERFDKAQKLLAAVSKKIGCIVFVIEGLHIIDISSVNLLRFLVKRIQNMPLLIVTTYRSGEIRERQEIWNIIYGTLVTRRETGIKNVKTISLSGFTLDETRDFIVRKCRERELLATPRENHLNKDEIRPEEGLISTIHDKSKGNPLFIEQVLKLLDEKGCLMQQEGVLRMVKNVDYTELSKELDLYNIIDIRAEHMKINQKKHYDQHKYASVIGERFSSHALSALESELETKSMANSLKSAADTYRLIQYIDDLLFQFSNTLIREVFYDRLRDENLDPSPAEMHARVAQWLKKEYGENLERDQIISLADHFAKGTVFDEAMYYLGLAAEQLRSGGTYHELQKVLERMVSLLETNKVGTLKEWYDVLFRLGETYEILGDKSKAVNALRRAVEIATEIDDSMKKAAAMVRFGVSLFHSGDYQKSIEELECAREIYEVEETAGTLSTEQCASYGTCLDYIGENYRELGELKEAEIFHNKVIQLVGQSEDNKLKSVAAHAYAQLGAIQLRQHNYQETLKYWNRALEISEQITDKPWMAHFAIDVGFVYLLTEKYDCAIEYLTRGVSHAVEGYFEDNIARGLMNRASVYFVEGKAADARTDYERALSIAEDNSVVRLTWRIKYNLGNVYRATGDVATAKKCYLEAIKQIEELRDGHRTPEEKSGFMQHRLRPYQTMIMLAWEEGDMETAKEFVERGMHKSLKVFSNRADGGLDFDAEKEIDKNFFVVNGKGYYVETE